MTDLIKPETGIDKPKNYVDGTPTNVIEECHKNLRLIKIFERVCLTISFLLAIFLAILSAFRNDLYYIEFPNKRPAETLAEYYYAHSVLVLLSALLILPFMAFREFQVNYTTVCIVIVFFVVGITDSINYRNKTAVKIYNFSLSVVYFYCVSGLELAFGITAIGLRLGRIEKKAKKDSMLSDDQSSFEGTNRAVPRDIIATEHSNFLQDDISKLRDTY